MTIDSCFARRILICFRHATGATDRGPRARFIRVVACAGSKAGDLPQGAYAYFSPSGLHPCQGMHPRYAVMTRNDIARHIRQRPLAPFRLDLTEGTGYEVRHPEQIMLARDSVVIGVPGQAGEEDFFETTVLVDRFHMVRLEPLSAQ